MGWFPYLFYSTTYVAEVMANELGHEPDIDKATRAGSFALLIYSTGKSSWPWLFADVYSRHRCRHIAAILERT